MSDNTITFQLATQYLSKVALKLECLFFTVKEATCETHPVIHHYALKNVMEILKLTEKPELKSRFLKELMLIEHNLIKNNSTVSKELSKNLSRQIQILNNMPGNFCDFFQYDSFLQSIKFNQTGDYSNDFENPQLILWLENSIEKKQKDLKKWLKYLQLLYDTVSIYLSILRYSATFDKINMLYGFYHHSLSTRHSCHLILLKMDKECGIVPKMQLGHHGLSVRLCEANSMNEIKTTDTSVNLGICHI